MIDPQLNGKVALTTGTNHGIGAANALALGRQGVDEKISYISVPYIRGIYEPPTHQQ